VKKVLKGREGIKSGFKSGKEQCAYTKKEASPRVVRETGFPLMKLLFYLKRLPVFHDKAGHFPSPRLKAAVMQPKGNPGEISGDVFQFVAVCADHDGKPLIAPLQKLLGH
jgi:hypothetical protein